MKASTSGYKIQKELKQAYTDAIAVRVTAKRAIMTDWVLDNILNDPKTDPDSMKAQANEITEMIKRTNPSLPKFLTDLVDTMSGTAPPEVGVPAAAAPSKAGAAAISSAGAAA